MDPSYGGACARLSRGPAPPCAAPLLAHQADAWHAKLARCARADKTWKVLEDAIHEINNHNASGLSFEELYRSAPCPARAVGQASAGTAVRARGSPVWRPAAVAPVLPAQWCWTLLAGRCVVPSTRSLQPSGANDEVQRPLVNGQLVAVLAGRPRPRLTTGPPATAQERVQHGH